MHRHTALSLFFLIGCTSTDTDSGSDANDDTLVVEQVTWDFSLQEYLSSEPLQGATLTVGDSTFVTDEQGSADLLVDGSSDIMVNMTQDGFPEAHFYRFMGPDGWNALREIPSNDTIALLAATLGLEPDPSKGILLAINSLACTPTDDPNDCAFLSGITIDIDANYDVALADDRTQPTGLSVSNVSIDSAVSFANVDPGPISLTLTPPEGYSCEYVHSSIEVFADHYHEVTLFCPPS
jgi:hypothetical protein